MLNKEIYYTQVYIHEFLRGYDEFDEGNKKEAPVFKRRLLNGYCISTACFDNVFVISQY